MDKCEFENLLQRYQTGACTPQEVEAIEHVFATGASELGKINDAEMRELKRTWIESSEKITRTGKRIKVVRLASYATAAACIAAIALGTVRHFSNIKPEPVVTVLTDIGPGGNRAKLTLADGSIVDLEEQKNGQIAQQGATQVQKLATGQLVYTLNPQFADKTFSNQLNTISTPKGGEYAINLPDGTKAWLNAASSITFPTDLGNGTAREISMTGEVYFEVAKDESRPFRVKSSDQTVEVLGTHFSINSYADEPSVKTSLLEGSVRITPRSLTSGTILKPGQQAILNQNSKIKIVPVDESVIAWRNGLIRNRGADLKTVMRQIARWYDLEVVYKGHISDEPINTALPRSSRLATVLEFLSGIGVEFTIEQTAAGKRIIVQGN